MSAIKLHDVSAFRQFEVYKHNLGRSQANGCGSKPHYRIVKTVLKPQETENKEVTSRANLRPDKPMSGYAWATFCRGKGLTSVEGSGQRIFAVRIKLHGKSSLLNRPRGR